MNKTSLKVLLCGLAIMLLPVAAQAFVIKADSSINIQSQEVIDGNLYAAGNSLVINGTVRGDVICAGQSVTVNGVVEGDVICAGQSVDISGRVGGNVRVAGNTIKISALVGRNAMTFGSTVVLGSASQIGWDVLAGAALLDASGKIGGNLHGGAAEAVINGEVGRDVLLNVESKKQPNKEPKAGLTVSPTAKIKGNLTYTSAAAADISDQAQIGGEVKQQQPKVGQGKGRQDKPWAWGLLWGKLFSIFTALVIGLVIINLWKAKTEELSALITGRFWPSLGWGLIVILLTPLLCLILLITLIGAPLALIISLLWVIALLISRLFVAIVIGRFLMQKFGKANPRLLCSLVMGVVVLQLIFLIPYLGVFVCLIATLVGAGALWQSFQKNLK